MKKSRDELRQMPAMQAYGYVGLDVLEQAIYHTFLLALGFAGIILVDLLRRDEDVPARNERLMVTALAVTSWTIYWFIQPVFPDETSIGMDGWTSLLPVGLQNAVFWLIAGNLCVLVCTLFLTLLFCSAKFLVGYFRYRAGRASQHPGLALIEALEGK